MGKGSEAEWGICAQGGALDRDCLEAKGSAKWRMGLVPLHGGAARHNGFELGWGHLGYSRDIDVGRVTTSEHRQVAKAESRLKNHVGNWRPLPEPQLSF